MARGGRTQPADRPSVPGAKKNVLAPLTTKQLSSTLLQGFGNPWHDWSHWTLESVESLGLSEQNYLDLWISESSASSIGQARGTRCALDSLSV